MEVSGISAVPAMGFRFWAWILRRREEYHFIQVEGWHYRPKDKFTDSVASSGRPGMRSPGLRLYGISFGLDVGKEIVMLYMDVPEGFELLSCPTEYVIRSTISPETPFLKVLDYSGYTQGGGCSPDAHPEDKYSQFAFRLEVRDGGGWKDIEFKDVPELYAETLGMVLAALEVK